MQFFKILLFYLCTFSVIYAQTHITKEYLLHIGKGDSLLTLKEYELAAECYENAFKSIGNVGIIDDLYKYTEILALAKLREKAFEKLFKLKKQDSKIIDKLLNNKNYQNLYGDSRWIQLIDYKSENPIKVESEYDIIRTKLESIVDEDQKYRLEINRFIKDGSITQKDSLISEGARKDSLHKKFVLDLINTYGWIGPEKVGIKGNSALFLVIQHSDLKTQEKCLPILKSAVLDHKASTQELVLLEDRILVSKGKKQIYGSQVYFKNGKYKLYPIRKPNQIDKRRASIGLDPIKSYLEAMNN